MKSEDVGLIVRTISFQDFQPMWSWSTNVTDRRTDGQTTSDSKTALWSVVHRAVKTNYICQVNGVKLVDILFSLLSVCLCVCLCTLTPVFNSAICSEGNNSSSRHTQVLQLS